MPLLHFTITRNLKIVPKLHLTHGTNALYHSSVVLQ